MSVYYFEELEKMKSRRFPRSENEESANEKADNDIMWYYISITVMVEIII